MGAEPQDNISVDLSAETQGILVDMTAKAQDVNKLGVSGDNLSFSDNNLAENASSNQVAVRPKRLAAQRGRQRSADDPYIYY